MLMEPGQLVGLLAVVNFLLEDYPILQKNQHPGVGQDQVLR